MTTKIKVLAGTEEHLVASFNTPIEAFQCAAFLQALHSQSKVTYMVEYKDKRRSHRQEPSDLLKTIAIMPEAVKNQIRELLM